MKPNQGLSETEKRWTMLMITSAVEETRCVTDHIVEKGEAHPEKLWRFALVRDPCCLVPGLTVQSRFPALCNGDAWLGERRKTFTGHHAPGGHRAAPAHPLFIYR